MDTTSVVGVMPKTLGNPYFASCREGAEEAARERGFQLRWEAPRAPDARAQARQVAAWVEAGLPAIAVSVEDAAVVSPALREARARGVRVLTWDADAEPDARELTVVQATPESVAQALAFEAGRMLGGKGQVGVITSTPHAPNQRAWLEALEARLRRDFPGVEIAAVVACGDDEGKAAHEAAAVLVEHPDVRVLVGLCAPAVPGAARARREAGRRDVRVTGLCQPSACRADVEAGWVDSLVTWSTVNLGYLAAWAASALARRELEPGALTLAAGRLGHLLVKGDEVRLGRLHILTAGNVDTFAG